MAGRLVNKEIESLFADMGKAWDHLVADPQLRWFVTIPITHLIILTEAELNYECHTRVGPEKGVIHIATAAVDNALWDLYARAHQKPLWKLIVDMSPVCFGLARYALWNS